MSLRSRVAVMATSQYIIALSGNAAKFVGFIRIPLCHCAHSVATMFLCHDETTLLMCSSRLIAITKLRGCYSKLSHWPSFAQLFFESPSILKSTEYFLDKICPRDFTMSKSKIPAHINSLLEYLAQPKEKSRNDLADTYFRTTYPNFLKENDAHGADSYVPGHFVVELKGKSNDWYSGLLQAIAYKRNLDFSLVIVVAQGLLAVWNVEDIPSEILENIFISKAAPNQVGK